MSKTDVYISPWWQSLMMPRKWNICGLEVFSLTLWHAFALSELGNPYLCGGVPDMDAAASLLMVAARDMDGGRRLMLDAKARARAMFWLCRRLRRLNPGELHNACADYVMACMRMPDHKIPEKPKEGWKSAAAPYQFHVVLCLCSQYRMTISEAWNTPCGIAACVYDAWRETQGDDTLANAKLQRNIDQWSVQTGGA